MELFSDHLSSQLCRQDGFSIRILPPKSTNIKFKLKMNLSFAVSKNSPQKIRQIHFSANELTKFLTKLCLANSHQCKMQKLLLTRNIWQSQKFDSSTPHFLKPYDCLLELRTVSKIFIFLPKCFH